MPARPPDAIINPEADRILSRIGLRYGILVFVLLILDTFLFSYVNALYHAKTLRDLMTPKLVALNLLSILIVLVPFYLGIYRLFTARLAIGRERVQARAWGEAVAALDPFAARTQRFLDRSGEAHYLLAQAYAGLGDRVRAENARAFVRRKNSVWAEKLSPGKSNAGKSRDGKKMTPARQEKQPPPPKGKPRRRF